MLCKTVIIFIILCLSTVNSQHVSLIGSHLLPINNDYKVYLQAQNLGPDSVINVTLESGDEYENFMVFDNFTLDLSKEIPFDIPDDLPPNYKLNIIHKNKATNSCTKESIRIRTISNRRLLLIQLDKPVYKNGDTVKFRTFLMDHRLIPINSEMINVTIFDGNGNVIRKFENVQTSKIGVYEHYFKVAESPNFGQWMIRVDVTGKSKSKKFQVLQHDEGSFQVLITSLDKEVAFANKFVFFDVQVKHPTDKIFTGVVKISSTARDAKNQDVMVKRSLQDVKLPLLNSVVAINIANELGIRSPSSDMIIEFDVEVVEDKTQKSEKVKLKIPMRYKGKHNLLVYRDSYFKPGFDFPMIIQINDLNGKPDSSLNSLRIIIDYEGSDPDTHMSTTDKQVFEKHPKNGEVEVVLHPTINTKQIKVHLEFADTELMETIKSIQNIGVDEYMQAEVLNKEDFYKVPKTLQLSVKSSNTFENLHVLVLGSNGLLDSKEYTGARLNKDFNFNLELTEKMTPKCLVLMFYVRKDDGLIVYDEIPLSFQFSLNNSLNLAPVQKMKSNQMVNLKFKSQTDSFVFLSAIDENYASVNTVNEISRSEMYREAIQFMNQKFRNNSMYQFNRFNAFVMQPLVTGRSCDEDIEDVPEDVANKSDMVEFSQKYFPDIWFDDIIEVKSDKVQSLQKKLPDDLTTWRIVGASMHPTKGFAVVSPVQKVKVEREIVLKVHTPATIHEGEILKVEFSVFNFLGSIQNAQVTVDIENGDLMTEKWTKKSWFSKIWCNSYMHKNQKSFQLSLQLPSGSMSKSQSFFVQASSLGAMKVKITANVEKVKDIVEKIVSVQSRKSLRRAVAETFLIESQSSGSLDKKLNFNLSPKDELVNVYATLSGNLLGPVINDLDKISNLPMSHTDQRPYKFASSVIVAEYFEAKSQIVPDQIMDEMLKGYQEVLAVLQNENLFSVNMKSWLYSYSVSALIDSKNFMKIDDREVEKALDKLRTKQNADGSFSNDPIELIETQKAILTAQITLAFIKYQKYSDKYEEVIKKAMKYLNLAKEESVSDHEKVIVAYTLAMHGEEESSRKLTSSMQNLFLNATKDDSKMSMYVEIASYLIELKINNHEDAKAEVEWLLNQRDVDGSFYSPCDTLLALNALHSYAAYKHTKQTSLSFKIDDEVEALVDENEVKYMNLSKQNQHNLNVIGEGLGYVTLHYEYFQNSSLSPHKNFIINVETKELSGDKLEMTINVKLTAAGMSKTNMAIIEVEMPSGYEYYGQTEDEHVQMIEDRSNRSLAILYVDTIEANKMYSKVIQAVKVYQIVKSAKSTIKVYDFYRPNVRDEIQYDFDNIDKQCS